ncbi:protein of unknown function DUF429 [Pyrolobus fumarii 1A]|uniref:DUF429 domain-containing protein n=1 Tax=Pyrolobus fumarii (strain DSM 11204 / 1A) TaxID=694429 RepID=G0ECZ9_PYRF1|nr:DUF429 domain-containing protein [Pyrolobus fumarii]AEM39719.1 protein of unknown function DUF429 [Pyrolobus fumarii 1A]
MIILGVDPGLRRGGTGVAVAEYRGGRAMLLDVRATSLVEAAWLAKSLEPHVVVVDSPLSLPSGPWRRIDLVGKRLGLRLLPPGWRGMRRMVEEVTRLFRGGWLLLETHPSSVVRVSGCPSGEALVENCFDSILSSWSTRDELDAAIAACVGVAFIAGFWARIEASDGSIWLVDPMVCRKLSAPNRP